MNFNLFVLIFALAISACLAEAPCPDDNSYYHSFPHADCHKFYKCDWGKHIEFDCPLSDAAGNKLVFNPILQVCDWPSSAIAAGADCAASPPEPSTSIPTPSPSPATTQTPTASPSPATTASPTPSPLPPTTAAPGSGLCPPNNEYYHSYPHEDCHKFYICNWGVPVEMTCPLADAAGNLLVFNPVLQVCDWPGSAIAAGAVCSVSPPESTTSAPTESPTPSPTEVPTASPSPSTTSAPTESPTPSPTEVPTASPSPSTTAHPTPSPAPSTTAAPGSGLCPPNNEYYHSYPHETDCHKFYVCDWGKAIEMTCPLADAAGNLLVFNPVLQVCDWPGSAIAAGAVCSVPPPESTTSAPTESPTPSPTEVPTASPSPSTTAHPTPSPEPSTTAHPTPSPAPSTTAAPGSGLCPPNNEYYHSYPHETDCHKFYVCDWGKAIEMTCPLADAAGNLLVFNPVLQVCDWPGSAIAAGAVCSVSPPESTTSAPTESPTPSPTEVPTASPSPSTTAHPTPSPEPSTTAHPTPSPAPSTTAAPGSGLCPPNNEYYHSYPHETDCHKFYVCDWGKAIEMTCPLADAAGNLLVFNPVLQVCDWPGSATSAGAVCSVPPPETTTSAPTESPTPSPTEVPTASPSPSTTAHPTPSPAPSTTAAPGSGLCPPNNEYYHSYSHETDCHKFYVCDWGKAIEKICPLADADGNLLVFNPALQVCDWQNSAISAGAVC